MALVHKKPKLTQRRGRWVVDYYVGSVRKRPSFDTKSEAQNFMSGIRIEREGYKTATTSQGIPIITIKEAIRRYFDVSCQGKASEGSMKRHFTVFYEYIVIEKHLEFISEITMMHLESLQQLLKQKNKNATVNRFFVTYKSFFNRCVDWEIIDKSPALKIKKLPESATSMTLWDDESIQKVMDSLPKWASEMFYLIALTGIRPGEARKLKWGDVDFNNKVVTFSSIKGNGNERKRIIPMTDEVLSLFSEIKSSGNVRAIANKEEYVWPTEVGKMRDDSSLMKAVKRSRDALGLPKELTVYGLRHTFITRLAVMDVNLEKVRLIAGHSKSSTTERYMHLNKNVLRDVMVAASTSRKINQRSQTVTGSSMGATSCAKEG